MHIIEQVSVLVILSANLYYNINLYNIKVLLLFSNFGRVKWRHLHCIFIPIVLSVHINLEVLFCLVLPGAVVKLKNTVYYESMKAAFWKF